MPLRIFSVDVGGTAIKAAVIDDRGKVISSYLQNKTPYPFLPKIFERQLREFVRVLPSFNRISIGFPGVVRGGKVLTAPHFGTDVWAGYAAEKSLAKIFGKPVRIVNDADMHGGAVIRGKDLELVVTLGTGIGTALFRDGELMPRLELAHHPVSQGKTYNQYIGDKVLKQLGKKRWNRRVREVLDILHRLTHYDRLYLGGGNAAKINFKLGPKIKIISNQAGTLGGIILWQKRNKKRERTHASKS